MKIFKIETGTDYHYVVAEDYGDAVDTFREQSTRTKNIKRIELVGDAIVARQK